ncbi:hypothetical protein FPOAC2_03486 [Fusarium poae]|nr:hypothetical protein FPOAC1_003375 [Fusarium poae]KAG8677359.1 hypothetical protein FPOAC1_003375 [Fusarium poae]
MVRWYSAFGANFQHEWTPRKAYIRGYSPVTEPAPSLMAITRVGEPTPIFGPEAAQPTVYTDNPQEAINAPDASDTSEQLGHRSRHTARILFAPAEWSDDEGNNTSVALSSAASPSAASPSAASPSAASSSDDDDLV